MPSVLFNIQDGRLGITPPSGGEPLVIAGTSSAGVVNQPTLLTRVKNLVDGFGIGDAPNAAALAIALGLTVLFVKTGASTAASNGAVDQTGKTGTSVVTVTGGTTSAVTAEIWFKVLTGGTIGVAGIVYAVSRDGGLNYDPPKALGTANLLVVDGSGIGLSFAAGTLVAGDIVKLAPKAAEPNDAELLTALNAANAHTSGWELVHPVVSMTSGQFDICHTFLDTATTTGRPCSMVGATRMPNSGETDTAYQAAISTIFVGLKQSSYIELTAGDCRATSQIDGSRYRQPFGPTQAAFTAKVAPHMPTSAPILGGVKVDIRDALGNPSSHDESVNPGLDAGRFSVLTTIKGLSGVYPHNAQLFSPAGSDFDLHAHRRVMNKALKIARIPLILRIQKPVPVYRTTGLIVAEEAQEIQDAVQRQLEGEMSEWVSAVEFAVSRSDVLLSTRTITTDLAIIPLGYPNWIRVNVGFRNPALEVRQV